MALVSYDCSDSSDYEDNVDDKNENNGNIGEITLLETKVDNKDVDKEDNVSSVGKNDLLLPPVEKNDLLLPPVEKNDLLLPPVEIKSNFNVVSWSLLSKYKTQPIRISVPSLEDDEKEVAENKSKPKPSSTKSGLFALLPKPKQQLLVPSSLNLKKQVKKKEIIKSPKPEMSQKTAASKVPKVLPMISVDNDFDDIDEDDEQPQSFFFTPETKIEDQSFANIDADLMDKSKSILDEVSLNQEESTETCSNDISISQSSSYDVQPNLPDYSGEIELDNEALEKLCGRKGGKRMAGEIEMVDVSGAELMGDSKLWLAKELTTQKSHFKRAKFDPLQRRKHQITYLAAHAREQELELSNQWANNRMTRKQTQAKYGF